MAAMKKFSRKIIWVHGAFIVLILISFGTLSVTMAPTLAAGTPLARALCGVIAIFWLLRLAVQLTFFDARPHLTTWFYKLGYHTLTVVFAYLATVYCIASVA